MPTVLPVGAGYHGTHLFFQDHTRIPCVHGSRGTLHYSKGRLQLSSIDVQKQAMRAEAKRQRASMEADADVQDEFIANFFKVIQPREGQVVASYAPKGREFDVHPLVLELVNKGIKVSLPVIQDDDRLLKFAVWSCDAQLVKGKFGVFHPSLEGDVEWAEPDIFIVPLLAFDRKGFRLGYGGGYYDKTIAHYRDLKDIVTVGVGYAQQACLFNLPVEDHDEPMDHIITSQHVLSI